MITSPLASIRNYREEEDPLIHHYFTPDQLTELRLSPYVQHVSETRILYNTAFKKEFIQQRNQGKTATAIFQDLGFDIDLIGKNRIEGIAYRLKDYATFEDYLKKYEPKDPTEGMTDKQLVNYYRHLSELQAQELLFLKKKRIIDQKRDAP